VTVPLVVTVFICGQFMIANTRLVAAYLITINIILGNLVISTVTSVWTRFGGSPASFFQVGIIYIHIYICAHTYVHT